MRLSPASVTHFMGFESFSPVPRVPLRSTLGFIPAPPSGVLRFSWFPGDSRLGFIPAPPSGVLRLSWFPGASPRSLFRHHSPRVILCLSWFPGASARALFRHHVPRVILRLSWFPGDSARALFRHHAKRVVKLHLRVRVSFLCKGTWRAVQLELERTPGSGCGPC